MSTRRLGRVQQQVLGLLRESGYFCEACGWVWSNYSTTERVLDALVKRGLVIKSREPWPSRGHIDTWRPKEAGK